MPLSTHFLIAYNPFKVIEVESTAHNLFCPKYSLAYIVTDVHVTKFLKSSRTVLPIICVVCGFLPDVGASTNKSTGWRESDIVHRFTCINSLRKSLIILSFKPPTQITKEKKF